MNKQSGFAIIFLLISLLFVVSTALLLVFNNSRDTQTSNVTEPTAIGQNTATPPEGDKKRENLIDAEVKAKFNCDRNTDDERDTDIFCRYPELYKEGIISIDKLKEQHYCDEETGQYPVCSEPNGLENLKNELEKSASLLR